MTLTAEVLARLKINQTGPNDFGGPNFAPVVELLIQLTDGVAAGQANLAFVDERTVATGATDSIDLAGVLTDAFGATITAAEVVALMIINKPRTGTPVNTTDLTIGGGSNGVFATAMPFVLKPGAVFLLAAADAAGVKTVTAGTADILTVVNGSGASAKYQLAVLARNA
jgi:hypothetical protein